MEQRNTDVSIANDVLHNENHSKLTQEEIAKAIAHHNKRHKEDHAQNANGPQGMKPATNKPK